MGSMHEQGCRSAAAVAAVVLTLTIASSPAIAQGQDVELVNAVVASVDGVPVTMRDLDAFAAGEGRLLSPEERSTRTALLDAMVKLRMFAAEYEANGINATNADVEIYIDHLIAESGSSREAVRNALDRMGLSWDDYFRRMRQEAQRLALINREIRSRVNVTPEEVERFWKESPDFLQPERMEIGHVFIPFPERATPEQIETLRARAMEAHRAARKNFAKAAHAYSEGPNAEEGGVLGTFRRGTMAPMFERELEGMSEGDVSEPFEAEGAIHIIKLVRVVPTERVPLEKVRSSIEERLYDEALDTRFKRWVEEDLLKRHHITMQLDEIDDLIARDDRS